ncbi:MAG: hypothetical protein ACYCUM_04525 [Solirubrobacteraceae bacterium]
MLTWALFAGEQARAGDAAFDFSNATDTFTKLAGTGQSPAEPREGAVAATLPSGQVLIAGGATLNAEPFIPPTGLEGERGPLPHGPTARTKSKRLPKGVQASRLHRLVPSVVSFATDGVRYAAWQAREGGPLIVLDTLTGRRKTMTLPAGCNLDSEDEDEEYGVGQTAAAGRFLLSCRPETEEAVSASSVVFSPASGKALALPRGFGWFRLGSRYAEGVREPFGGGPFIDDLATGRVRKIRGYEAAALQGSGAPGQRSICAKLSRRVRKLGGLSYIGGNFSYQSGVLARQYGVRGEVAIEHCHGRPILLEGQHIGRSRGLDFLPHDFDLRGGLISWDTGGAPAENEERVRDEHLFRATLSAYTLATGARYRWPLPRIHVTGAPGGEGALAQAQPPGYSSHTASMVFWIATRSIECGEDECTAKTAAVYAARL